MPSSLKPKSKKIYSLKVNHDDNEGEEEISVEVETIPGLPTPQVPRKWLKGLVARRLRKEAKIGAPRGNCTPKAPAF